MPDERPDGRRRYVALFAIVVLAVGLRAAWVAYLNLDPTGRVDDSGFYFAAATSLARDFSYRNQFGQLAANWPPGYPLAVAGVFAILGTKLVAAEALNVAFSGATVLLTYVVGARAFGTRAGLLAATLLALAPGHAYFSALVMAEMTFAFGFLAVIVLLLNWTVDTPSLSWWWWLRLSDDPAFRQAAFSRAQEPRMLALGIATGLLTLVRAEGVFLVPIFAVLWLVILPRWRPLLWYGAIFVAGFVLALTPWTVRNAVQFHRLIPLRDQPQAGLANGLDRSYPERMFAPPPPLADVGGYMARHPWELAPLEGAKIRRLYRNDSDAIDWSTHNGPPALTPTEARRWSHMADWYFFAVGLTALASAPLLWRRRNRWRAVLAYMLLAWTAVLIIAWPETRYHMPLVPILCMFAGWTFVSSYDAVVARMASKATNIDLADVPSASRQSPAEAGILPDGRTEQEVWTDSPPDAPAAGGQPGLIDAEGARSD